MVIASTISSMSMLSSNRGYVYYADIYTLPRFVYVVWARARAQQDALALQAIFDGPSQVRAICYGCYHAWFLIADQYVLGADSKHARAWR
jgi:hypothetical protein